MYYIAGLTSSTQIVEGLAVFTTFRYFQYLISRMRAIAPVANAEAGGLSIFIPPVTYILCVTFNRFVQPAWMQRMSLPNTHFNHEIEVGLRVAACAATFVLLRVTARTLTLLGNQWHAIGRREKSRLVQTGAYAVVRHPGYASVLIQGLLFAVMTWSYAPLLALSITAGTLAVKMPIEEDLIMQDASVAGEYRAYMQRVPARVIPYLW